MRETLRRTSGATLATVLLLAVAACSDAATDAGTSGNTTPSASSDSIAADLTITSVNEPGGTETPRTYTLTCAPTGGDLPSADQACAALQKPALDPFEPVPASEVCTDIYGGDGVITIAGSWNGDDVDATFTQRDGCEIKRFNKIVNLFGIIVATALPAS